MTAWGEHGKQWLGVAAAQTAMTAVVGTATYMTLGSKWLAAGLGVCLGGIAFAAWYTVSGRTLGNQPEVRERVLERHYVGVAWYASMLRTSQERGGYERGLRAELTRLCAARLAERRGVNLYQDPAIARELVGPDLWPLVDPAMHPRPSSGNKPPPVPMRAVSELIERLEQM